MRRLAVLKIWVDAHGLNALGTVWRPGHEALPFDPTHWLRERRVSVFDVEDIGQLAVPAPDLDDLGQQLRTHYGFLGQLDGVEQRVAELNGGDRPLVLKMIADLPGSRLTQGSCW
jgi:hypothetical protein